MRCRLPRQSMTWTQLVDSDMNQDEVTIAVLTAAKEHLEDQERQIEELKRRVGTYRLSLLALAHLNMETKWQLADQASTPKG